MKKNTKSKSNSKKDYSDSKSIITNEIKEPFALYHINSINLAEENWDFKNHNTKEFTHCFHNYPAMMIPQVARRIINLYGTKAKNLFDPYCGTGTSLVEANLSGINGIGTDLNPLARLIAMAKTTKIDLQVLDLFLQDFFNYFFALNFQLDYPKSVIIPKVTNMDFWFSKSTQQKLGLLLSYIEKINDKSIRNFFKIAFSETVRESSFVKSGEFKLVRDKNYMNKNDSDVINIMMNKLTRNKRGLVEFEHNCPDNTFTSIYDFNSVDFIPNDKVSDESIDMVVTSPPYGDSRTTVAYGQYSRLANEWLGFSEANQIDNKLMGGENKIQVNKFDCDILNRVIYSIGCIDPKRTNDVISFYSDYKKSIDNVTKKIKKKGFACYVVGNRTVKGINIPTDIITAEFFKENNFTHIETFKRNIPNKRMPLKNSPSNIPGVTASTMKNEYIVICQKN